MASGKQLRIFSQSVWRVAFSPDGKYVLTDNFDGTARLWRTDLQDVIRLACVHLLGDLTDDERKQYGITDSGPTCPPS